MMVTSISSRLICVAAFQWPNQECPVAFIDCTGPEQRASLSPGSTAGTSYQNNAEAHLVVYAIQQLLTGPHAIQPSEIGVITPYSGQVTLPVPSPAPPPPLPLPSLSLLSLPLPPLPYPPLPSPPIRNVVLFFCLCPCAYVYASCPAASQSAIPESFSLACDIYR